MQGKIPDEKDYHDPVFKNIYGETIAMILINKGIMPPKEWEHDKFLKNVSNETVA